MIQFPCSNCKKLLKAPPEKAGARSACPACKQPVVVPDLEEPVLDVLPVVGDDAQKTATSASVAPPPLKQHPRPQPTLQNCGRWEEALSILDAEDEGSRPVEAAGAVLDAVRKRLDEYAAAIPHHRVGGFGSRATVLSLTECCVFSISLKWVSETRRLGQGEAPYFGWKVPAREFKPNGLDLWDFRYRCRPEATGRSEHIIPASQTIHGCDQCRGQGAVACDTCRGSRAAVCSSCKGAGTQACGNCGGGGLVEVRKGTVVRQVRCPAICEAGYINQRPCYKCNGRGWVSEDSDDFGEVPCPKCRGGQVACSTCRGARQVPCSACTGTGLSKCGRCRGGKQLVRYASVVRTLEPGSETTTTPGEGCEEQVVQLLVRRPAFLQLLRLTTSDLPPRPLLEATQRRVISTARTLLDSVRFQVTTDRRIASLVLEVGRAVALKVEYDFGGRRYAAWLLGQEKAVHAPANPVTDALLVKLQDASKLWRQQQKQQKKDAAALVREAVEMAQKCGYCRAVLDGGKKAVPSDLWEAATNPGVLQSLGNFFGKLFG